MNLLTWWRWGDDRLNPDTGRSVLCWVVKCHPCCWEIQITSIQGCEPVLHYQSSGESQNRRKDLEKIPRIKACLDLWLTCDLSSLIPLVWDIYKSSRLWPILALGGVTSFLKDKPFQTSLNSRVSRKNLASCLHFIVQCVSDAHNDFSFAQKTHFATVSERYSDDGDI